MMRDRSNLQGRTKARQLQFEFGGCLSPKGANDDDPFSAPSPTRGVFNGVRNDGRKKEPKFVRLDLGLRDAIARQGPPYAYEEG